MMGMFEVGYGVWNVGVSEAVDLVVMVGMRALDMWWLMI